MTLDYGTKTLDLYFEGMRGEGCVRKVRAGLSDLDGIEYCDVKVGHARVTYLPQTVSPEQIQRAAGRSGYPVGLRPPRRNVWQRLLERMIRSNERMFGDERPDCCSINGDQEQRMSRERQNRQ